MRLLPGWVLSLLGLLLLAGCVDTTSATGEMGRIRYELVTEYDVPQGDLRDARIITRHEQELDLELTSRGSRDIPQPRLLTHRFVPAEGTTAETGADSTGSDVFVMLTVDRPGPYTLQSMLGDEVMDQVDLKFEQPSGFEMVVKVRTPWGEHFDAVSGNPIPVEEGSQMVLLPVPVDASRARLAGDMTTDVGVDPEWAVTPGQNILYNSERGMWTCPGELDFYFIEPELVTFTVSDPATAASSTQQFQVAPVAHVASGSPGRLVAAAREGAAVHPSSGGGGGAK